MAEEKKSPAQDMLARVGLNFEEGEETQSGIVAGNPAFGKFVIDLANKEYRSQQQIQFVNAITNEMRLFDEAQLVKREAEAQSEYYEKVLKAIHAGEFVFDRATNEMIFNDHSLRLGHWQSPLRGAARG